MIVRWTKCILILNVKDHVVIAKHGHYVIIQGHTISQTHQSEIGTSRESNGTLVNSNSIVVCQSARICWEISFKSILWMGLPKLTLRLCRVLSPDTWLRYLTESIINYHGVLTQSFSHHPRLKKYHGKHPCRNWILQEPFFYNLLLCFTSAGSSLDLLVDPLDVNLNESINASHNLYSLAW